MAKNVFGTFIWIRRIVDMRSDHQNVVFIIFKTIFVRSIRPICPDKLSSVIAKTVMFWTCEKYSSDHPLWNPAPTRTLLVLNHLFNELLNVFKNNYLSNFFLPQINVLPSTLGRPDSRKIIQKIKMILDDLISHIPSDDDVTVAMETSGDVLRALTSSERVSERLKDKDYTVLCSRPELITKLFKLFVADAR